MKKWYIIVAVSLMLILAAVFFVLQANSQDLALNNAGLDLAQDLYVIERLDLNEDGAEFRVLQGTMKDGKLALVQLTKNDWGFWQVDHLKTEAEGADQIASAWVKKGGRTRFSETDVPHFHAEYHVVYCGNNAQKRFALDDLELPPNITVDAYQVGQFYVLHMTAIDLRGEDSFELFDLPESLRNTGFLPAVS